MPRRTPGYRKIANGTPPLNVDADRLAAFFTTIAVRPTVVELRKVLNLAGSHLSSFIQQMATAYANIARIPDESARGRLFKELSKIERRHRRLFREQMRERVAVDVSSYLRHQDVRPVLRQAFERNWSLIKTIPPQAAKHLEKQLSVMSTFDRREVATAIDRTRTVTWRRARLIARDQNNKLVGQLSQMRQTAVGVEQYEWVTSADERVRPTHRAVSGQVFRWDSPPDIGHPGEDIQCRCHASPVWPKSAFARPKRPPPPPPPPPVPPGKAAADAEIEKLRALIRATPAGIGRRFVLRRRIKVIEYATPSEARYQSGVALGVDSQLKDALAFALRHERLSLNRHSTAMYGHAWGSQVYRQVARELWTNRLLASERRRLASANWRANLKRAEAKIVQPDLDTMIEQTELMLRAARSEDDILKFTGRAQALRDLKRYAPDRSTRKAYADWAASRSPLPSDLGRLQPADTTPLDILQHNTLSVAEAKIVAKPNWRRVLTEKAEAVEATEKATKEAVEAIRAGRVVGGATPERAAEIKRLRRAYGNVGAPAEADAAFDAAQARRKVNSFRSSTRQDARYKTFARQTIGESSRQFGTRAAIRPSRIPEHARIEAEMVRRRIAAGGSADARKTLKDLRVNTGPKTADEAIQLTGLNLQPPASGGAAWTQDVKDAIQDMIDTYDWDVLEKAFKGMTIQTKQGRGNYGQAQIFGRDHSLIKIRGTNISPRQRRSTTAHEIAHVIEARFRGQANYNKTSSTPARRLKARLFAEKSASELDSYFRVHYKGPSHSFGYALRDYGDATEMITRGTEAMLSKHVPDFAYEQPEWFRLIYYAMRGYLDKPSP